MLTVSWRPRAGALSRFLLKGSIFVSIAVLASSFQTAAAVSSSGTPTVTTDQADYFPNQTVVVTGTDFEPNPAYDVPIIRPNGSIVFGDGSFLAGWDSATTDGSGFVHLQLQARRRTRNLRGPCVHITVER
jgi:hypothetical protein